MVYAGAERARDPIYNEKVLAGLGKGFKPGGTLPAKGRARAIRALDRFARLLQDMKIRKVRCVATAAVRDAADGRDFVREVRKMGLPCEVLSDVEEARHAGDGVLYGIPGADGIGADLGGGSLELIDLDGRNSGAGVSLPLGVLRVTADAAGRKAASKAIRAAIGEAGLRTEGRSLYLVGGSWRALARIDMAATDFPLPITHQYRLTPKRVRELVRIVGNEEGAWKARLPSARQATAPVAAMLLDVLTEAANPKELVVSATGVREGLLYADMRPVIRHRDPLIDAAREGGSVGASFGQHGDALDDWLAPLFDDDDARMRRLRLASCLLADVAWQADSAFRAERAIETALHGNWLGIDAPGRVLLAQALSSSFGSADLPDTRLDGLCPSTELQRAHLWGLAIRLGQRLSAGVGSVLARVPISLEGDHLTIAPTGADAALLSEAVMNRLDKLAEAMGTQAHAA